MKKIIISMLLAFTFCVQNAFANVCENLHQYTLCNGQTVIIKEVKNNPIVIIDTFIKTGSVNENDQNNGVAHFLEHLFFKGTTNHKRGEFEREIESRGGVFNAATSRDYTHYYVKIDSKHFDKALELHSDMLLNIAIPENELAMERKVVLEEITRSSDNPSSKVFDNFMKLVFNGNSYERKILGTNEIISNITRDEILGFHKKWYTPSNMVTVIVGDVDAKKILPKIAKSFGNSCSVKNSESKLPTPQNPSKENYNTRLIKETSDIDTGYMILGYPSASIQSIKEAYALGIAGEILAEGQNSILYKKLKEDENLILDIGAGNYELKNGGIFYISATFPPQNYEKVLNIIKNELMNFKNKPIDAKRLELIKNATKREYEYANENIANISNMLGYDVAIGNGINDYCNYLEVIESISPEFIQETVNKYFIEENLAISLLLPEKQNKITRSNNIVEIKNKTKNNAKLISKYKDIKKFQLSNGATLLLQPNSSNNVIATKIFIKGGSLIEAKAGTASILSNTIKKGTKNKTGKELEDALNNIGTGISISDNYEYFEVSMKTTKNDFDDAFPLLKEILETPIFPEEEIVRAKQDSLIAIKASRDNPQNIAFENYHEILYKNSPFLKTGRILEKTIPTITKEDVENLYKEIFSAKNMIISIVGNFDETDVINKFSTLENKKISKEIDIKQLKPTLSTLEKDITNKEAKNAKGAWIIQGWQTKGLSTNDFVTLKLISNYLGAGFSSKLFVNLRENKGLAYEVGASSTSSFNSGNIFMYIGTNPENIEEAQKGFAKEIMELRTSYIPQKELCDLKQMMIGRLKLATETNMSKAYMNGYYEFFDKGYQFGYDYPQLIEKVSVQDILEVANKYFSQPYIMSIVAEEKFINNKE